MNLPTQSFVEQQQMWPATGRHIMAHHDGETVVVYQAYRAEIGGYAIANGHFGGPAFSYARMSWIKPNFLWMMYRSDWGRTEGQQFVLALRLSRRFFEAILAEAVASSFSAAHVADESAWRDALQSSNVRLQWDPDHDPFGGKVDRRAIQLGLRGPVLEAYGQREIIEVIDMRAFVAEQRAILDKDGIEALQIPVETVYIPSDPAIPNRVKLDPTPQPMSVIQDS